MPHLNVAVVISMEFISFNDDDLIVLVPLMHKTQDRKRLILSLVRIQQEIILFVMFRLSANNSVTRLKKVLHSLPIPPKQVNTNGVNVHYGI